MAAGRLGGGLSISSRMRFSRSTADTPDWALA